MHQQLLERLGVITEEEKVILGGSNTINRDLYYADTRAGRDVIDATKVLENGRLIDIRPHTRFVHFPKHSHNYIEFNYICRGSLTHIIDGQKVTLQEGDLLFMNQHASHEILPAGEQDIAVNFMILPAFFDVTLQMISTEKSALRDFIVSCLTSRESGVNSLYFKAGDILPVQDLIESLIWTIFYHDRHRRTITQTAMGLLFMYLIDNSGNISISGSSYEQDLMLRLLTYIDTEYKDAALSAFAEQNGIDYYALGRLIKKNTGSTFRDLLLQKRMEQACFLLKNTPLTVDDISAAVGYDNTSFFHRLFLRTYGVTPRDYRMGQDFNPQ